MKFTKLKSGYGIIQREIMRMNISIQAKSVYCLLSSYTGKHDFCFPSIASMCKDLSLSKPMIIKYLKELEINQLIKKSKLNDDPWNHSNKYEIFYIQEDEGEIVETFDGKSDNSYDGKSENTLEGKEDFTLSYKKHTKINIDKNNINHCAEAPKSKNSDYIDCKEMTINEAKIENDKSLYHEIKNRFEAVYGRFESSLYGREGSAIKGLIKKAKDRFPDKYNDFIIGVVDNFLNILKTKSDKFIAQQPPLPSALNSGGIWPRVLGTMRNEVQPDKEYLEKIKKIKF